MLRKAALLVLWLAAVSAKDHGFSLLVDEGPARQLQATCTTTPATVKNPTCPTGFKLGLDGVTCYAACPSGYAARPQVDENYCFPMCPKNSIETCAHSGGLCCASCATGYTYVSLTKMCLENCPKGWEVTDSSCIEPCPSGTAKVDATTCIAKKSKALLSRNSKERGKQAASFLFPMTTARNSSPMGCPNGYTMWTMSNLKQKCYFCPSGFYQQPSPDYTTVDTVICKTLRCP